MNNVRFFCLLILLPCSLCMAQPRKYANGVEPTAGSWQPWVIPSVQAVMPAPPPAKKASQSELAAVLALQQQLDSAAWAEIHYWNAGPAAYRWQRIADNLWDSTQYWARTYAYMNVAIYDATLAAWQAKYTYARSRPFEASDKISSLVAVPLSPSYPCEHAVTAGAAATVLAYLFPAKADSLLLLAKKAGQSRVAAGLQYPSDVEAGFALGVQVAEQVIERAKQDGFDKPWPGKLPLGRDYYSGKPIKKDLPNLKTWALSTASQFRSPPPPAFEKDMEEMKAYTPDLPARHRAFRWEFSWPWGEVVDQKVLEYNLSNNAPRAALVYALISISDYDNQVAHWDSKYTYFRARPDQYDTTFVPLFTTPPSPSYPAGHATLAYCRAEVLSYLFPYDRQLFFEMAKEATHSRFEGGVHYPSDNVAGETLGRQVGAQIVRWAREKTPALVFK
ncbi:phosphatase PAP2 family protein [Cesiribacter andamanensis]|uniref:PAP2 superfamily protein n=1 Tax=Cesiribacter andamanensis AMV16 TaxID=1279009 RepID=M7NHR9_9BACT|nr:phosphatase PAP2 family protein [Cesiribacter andamanensis]EMR01345.1 PAP2 superfamily protein [Cesiribacter andamanensis AMV16]